MDNNLTYDQKNAYELVDKSELNKAFDYCEGYKKYLDDSKTERLAVKSAVALAEAKGFVEFEPGKKYTAGDKIYHSVRGKSLYLAIIGKKPLSNGMNIAGAHIDSPRLDLKQVPMYEDSEIAYFKTHYYGGVKKYQWVTIPLELRGVIALENGTVVDVNIGGDPNDPVFYITDLLPHLAADQIKKPLGEAIRGEDLNIVIGSLPSADSDKDKVKNGILRLLNEKYGVTEEDFLSAELEIVPASNAKDVGLDRSMIGAYGHDDRVCAYAELKAILDVEAPEKTAVCILSDKEEIGSEGVSGMQSRAFETFVYDLCEMQNVVPRRCFENSFCISADVCNAFDPTFPEVSEKRNNAKLNYGLGICKFTGSRGKSGSNDASAEVVAKLRRMFRNENVVWQMAELGKVDQGGGGTIAKFMANRNIDTIDAGVPVLSMHAPYELVSKLDCYMTYKGMLALYKSK